MKTKRWVAFQLTRKEYSALQTWLITELPTDKGREICTTAGAVRALIHRLPAYQALEKNAEEKE